MSSPDKTLLCRYHYDPLDRLADCTPSAQAHTQRFYLKERLTSEIQGSVQRSIFQQGDQLLAQQQRQDDAVETTLLATDQQRSVLHALDATQPHPLAYTPYGHRPAENGLLSLLGFNGERADPVTGHYLLGNGYRAFNPVLMRFNSPDSLSPFGDGGLNAYAYCVGDPVNRLDPMGHVSWLGVMIKHFPTAVNQARKLNAPAASAFFSKLDGTPHITEKILEFLPAKDLGSLASTSKTMTHTVDSVSDQLLKKMVPPHVTQDLEFLTPAMQGSVEGILPRRALFMHNEIQKNLNRYEKVLKQLAEESYGGAPSRFLKKIRTGSAGQN
jgi:RHS repeat-associated protein